MATRMLSTRFAILATAFGITALARSAAAREGGFEGGLRAGYGIPLGETSDDTSNNDLDNFISGIVPIWLDAGYRMNGNVFFGGYFQYGFGSVGDNFDNTCDQDGVDCSANSLRFGAQIHYHIAPQAVADPWIGYGIGYEWANVYATIDGSAVNLGDTDVTLSASGFEFANFQAGVDFMATDHFYLGPFLSFSLDQYDSADVECDGPAVVCAGFPNTADIDDKALHEWFVFGLRGGFTEFVR